VPVRNLIAELAGCRRSEELPDGRERAREGDQGNGPIHHRKADRVRAHVFLCLLAYYARHMR
jgi:hypothetical protein